MDLWSSLESKHHPRKAYSDDSTQISSVQRSPAQLPLHITWLLPAKADISTGTRPRKLTGNIALSSCPGKKVRSRAGSSGHRAADGADVFLKRNLANDFLRLRSAQITLVVNCLPDADLVKLGTPISDYLSVAEAFGLHVIRIPMLEGGVPQNSIERVAMQIDAIVGYVRNGANVLIHCKGGVGRASLVAACMLMRLEVCPDPYFAVNYLRKVRSPHAVETMRQEDFIDQYYKHFQARARPSNESILEVQPT